jgi:hypothetical protein
MEIVGNVVAKKHLLLDPNMVHVALPMAAENVPIQIYFLVRWIMVFSWRVNRVKMQNVELEHAVTIIEELVQK